MTPLKLIVGITGASGALYGKLLLKTLHGLQDQITKCDIIFSENARSVWKFELHEDPEQMVHPANFTIHSPDNFFAPIASGSAGYDVMIVCPCTMGTLGRIASGTSSDLLTRAADVMLKERKKLILVPREAPYNLIHLNNMKLLTEAGATICPASPSFYSHPVSIESLSTTVIERVLMLSGISFSGFHWGEH